MIRIRSSTNNDAWWFDGQQFGDAPWHHDETPTVKDSDGLLAALVSKLFGLARWGGERASYTGDVWTVGEHSLLVASITCRLFNLAKRGIAGFGYPIDDGHSRILVDALGEKWVLRGQEETLIQLAACHDLGEALGLQDPAGPFLDGAALAAFKVVHHQHQLAAESLINLPRDQKLLHPLRRIVHHADVLARVFERHVLWGDAEAYRPYLDEDGALLAKAKVIGMGLVDKVIESTSKESQLLTVMRGGR
jgi:hypothetical protein